MWSTVAIETSKPTVVKYKITYNDKALSFSEVIDLWKSSETFRNFFSSILRNSYFQAYFWETHPITSNTLNRDFEFVLVESSRLTSIEADDTSFRKHINVDNAVVSFMNLGKDAKLVVPTLKSDKSHYNHLAGFIRNCPEYQIDEFLKVIANEYEQLISEKPLWLSTAGLGVYWLHVRIDSHPKYYHYVDYKKI